MTKECDSLRYTIDMLMTPPSREVDVSSKSSSCASSRNRRRANPGQANSPNQTVTTTNHFGLLASHDPVVIDSDITVNSETDAELWQHLRSSVAQWYKWRTCVWYTPQSSDLLQSIVWGGFCVRIMPPKFLFRSSIRGYLVNIITRADFWYPGNKCENDVLCRCSNRLRNAS